MITNIKNDITFFTMEDSNLKSHNNNGLEAFLLDMT